MVTYLKFLVLLFAGFIHASIFGQDKKIIFQSSASGISSSFIRCILKDDKGYMWFGTSEGLFRYDGTKLYPYENSSGDPHSLSHNAVSTIIEDKFNNVWIGSSEGLNLYNRKKDNFINASSIKNANRFSHTFISALLADTNGAIWIGTGSGLGIYDQKKYTLDYYTHSIQNVNSLSSNSITCILADKDNNVWIGTQYGLNLFSIKDKKITRFFYSPNHALGLSHNYIKSLALDNAGNLWVGTLGGGITKIIKEKEKLVFKRYTQNKTTNSLSSNFILSLCIDNNLLWIGTENGGLNCLNINTDQITVSNTEEYNPNSIGSNSIWSLYLDNDQRILWIGTYNKGVNIVDRKSRKFDAYQKNISSETGLKDDDVTDFAEDNEGNLWIASDGGGICKFNPKTNKFNKPITKTLSSSAILTILFDSNENIWIGAWQGGVDKLDKNAKKIKNYNIEGIHEINNKVFSLYEDKNGNVWAGSSGCGLFLYSPKADKFIQVNGDEQSKVLTNTAYVTAVLKDNDNTLWVATANGLVSISQASDKHYVYTPFFHSNKKGSIISNSIETILEDSNHRLWFGSSDRGLSLFNKRSNTFISFQKNDGLPSNAIKDILEDEKGYLWISTSKGISRLDPATHTFKNFTQEDGLSSDKFYARSGIRTKSGRLYFGGKNGFISFHPDSIKENTFVPPVLLTNLKINNKVIKVDAEDSLLKKNISEVTTITLSHEQTSIAIDFAALNYTNASKNQYAYKLEGLEKDWNHVTGVQSAVYTNIDPGKYYFLVKGSNNDGVWNDVPTKLEIIIKPPIWKTWWAILIYTLMSCTLLTVFIRFRLEKINIRNQLNLERLAREKESELNQLKIQFFTNISHEFRTPLSLIIAPLQSLISSSDVSPKIKDQLSIISRNSERMMRLVNDLMDFGKLDGGKIKLIVRYDELIKFITEVADNFNDFARRRHLDFKIDSSVSSIYGWFDPDKLETILLNLLSNAFKFTSDGGYIKITIKIINKRNNEAIDASSQFLELSITNSGEGIPKEELPYIFDRFYQSKSAHKNAGTGIGLTLTKGFVELHHGEIRVESTPNQTTKFTLCLPIDQQAYDKSELYRPSTDVILVESKNYHNEISYREDQPELSDNKDRPEILIIEDNEELRNYLTTELNKKFITLGAKDGQEGIDMAFNKIPDLIVSDVLMPNKNGIELCKTIKTDIRTSHVPIVLLTAKTQLEEKIEGIETGADAYITKPFDIRFLTAQITQLIDLRRKLYALFSHDVYFIPGKITDNEIDQVFLQKTIDYITQNLTDSQLNVEVLSDLFNLSRSQFYRKLKALTGKTAVEFIRVIRLKQALKLMAEKKYTLAEIAYQTGFTSPSYFTRSFKDQYGKAPSEYLEPKV